MNKAECPILVCSCDSCLDILDVFFELLHKYWPDLSSRIYLSTETKNYKNKYFDIHVVHPDNPKCTWTERIHDAVGKIPDDQVLFLLDDFFLYDYVNSKEIAKTIDWLKSDSSIATFTYWPLLHMSKQSKCEGFCERTKGSLYKFTMIAGAWNKKWLMKYLSLFNCSAWKIELECNKIINSIGSGKFYALIGSQDWVFPYHFSKIGLTSGKWFIETKEVFEKNNIHVDYSKRGFFDPKYSSLNTSFKEQFRFMSQIFCKPSFLSGYKYISASSIEFDGKHFEQKFKKIRHPIGALRWIVSDMYGFSIENLEIKIQYLNNKEELLQCDYLTGSFKLSGNKLVFNDYLSYIDFFIVKSKFIKILTISGDIKLPATKKQLSDSYQFFTDNSKYYPNYNKFTRSYYSTKESVSLITLNPSILFFDKNDREIKKITPYSVCSGKFRYCFDIPNKTNKIQIFFGESSNFYLKNFRVTVCSNKITVSRFRKKYTYVFEANSSQTIYCKEKCSHVVISGRMIKPIPRYVHLLLRLYEKVKFIIYDIINRVFRRKR